MSPHGAFIVVCVKLQDQYSALIEELAPRRDDRAKVLCTMITGADCMLRGCRSFTAIYNRIKNYGTETVGFALGMCGLQKAIGLSVSGSKQTSSYQKSIPLTLDWTQTKTDEAYPKLQKLADLQGKLLSDLPRLPQEVLKIDFDHPDTPVTEELE